ncbi:type II toxin-antitoxin system HipA family toxin [Leifsonia sp. NPDC058194]|uniref:type II toxin-antitoxin system HipA family toxin n=1 Tax=Leifsonia sp. NPDC058194 TaxID=3346374 RepID=UPI0036D7D114
MAGEPTQLHDAVDVFLDEGAGAPVLVGSLRASFMGGRTLAGSSFEYAASYLANPARYALSPDLPLVSGRQYSGGDTTLFGAFADVTPDDWGTGLIDAEYQLQRGESQPRAIGEFDHLVQQNDLTRMGALRFTALGATPAPGGTPGPYQWLTAAQHTAPTQHSVRRIAEAAARFEEYEATDDDIEILRFAGSSLGGARPKATIRDPDGALWMLKLPSNRDRRSDLEAWEATALDIAERAGLRVPRHRLVRLAEHESSLLIERFDRVGAPDPHQHRVGFISAMTAMQLTPQNQRATYADLADAVDHLAPEYSREELRELFQRVALTVLVGNVDDHWKNHGFLREGSSWRLSPLYDVNPTRAGNLVRSRAISDRDDPANRDIRHLIESSQVYRMNATDAADALIPVLGAVATWPVLAVGNGISRAEIDSMASAFDETQFGYAEKFAVAHESRNGTSSHAGRRRPFPELY